MNCVCITGVDQKSVNLIASYLHSTGMSSAHKSLRADSFDINSWHQKAIEVTQIKDGTFQPVSAPGKLWDQLAGEIFVANIDSNIWGWADTRSTWALNYWHAFDANIYFILVCLSPEQMLTRAAKESEQDLNVYDLLKKWQHHHSELLRFYYRHPQRCILVDSLDCIANPSRLIDQCIAQFGLTLNAAAQLPEETDEPDALIAYLVRQFLKDMPEIDSVQREITASRICLSHSSFDNDVNEIAFSSSDCLNLYRDLYSRYNFQLEVSAKEARKNEHCQGQLIAFIQKQDGLNIKLSEKEAENTALASELTRVNENLQDNKLLLNQLHEVQEELEGYYLLHKEAQQQQNTLDIKLSKKEAENTALVNELTRVNENLQDNKLLLSQLHEVQEELEGYYLLHKEAQQQQNTLDIKLSEKETENTALVNELTRVNENLQDNELLLSQLHEVQEELERYYLQYKDVQHKFVASERRWQRMLQRRSDYWDFSAIKIIEVQQDQVVTTHWKIDNLDVGTRNIPHLKFKTTLEMGCTNILLMRGSESGSELIRWPSVVDQQSELVISAVADENTGPIRAECVLSLSSGDWDLVTALGRVLRNELATSFTLASALEENLMPVSKGIDRLLDFIDICPSVFRYDRVSLKKLQTNSDYEHLWLSFDNISFGSIHWPEFNFRISCANLRPQHFGDYPKLEFPDSIDQHPLQAWFPESYDDFGAKLELRFALPDALDIQVWTKLTDRDQSFLTSLVSRLPAILTDLRNSGLNLARGWGDWLNMIDHMRRILELRTSTALDSKVVLMSSANGPASKATLRRKVKQSV